MTPSSAEEPLFMTVCYRTYGGNRESHFEGRLRRPLARPTSGVNRLTHINDLTDREP
jgi:hypothetical protein